MPPQVLIQILSRNFFGVPGESVLNQFQVLLGAAPNVREIEIEHSGDQEDGQTCGPNNNLMLL